jgi:hypothetical protein
MVPVRRDRFILLVILNLLNWSMLAVGVASHSIDVPSLLLLVLISDFFVRF